MGRCPHGPNAHVALIGRQCDGTFHTSRAKVYPKGLNRILAEELYLFAIKLGARNLEGDMPDDFMTMATEQFFCEETVQPDYHG